MKKKSSRKYVHGKCKANPVSKSLLKTTPKTLEQANAADNLQIGFGSGTKQKRGK